MTDVRPSKPLHRLIYASLVTPETSSALDRHMRDILVASHPLNWRDGITGMLVCDGQWFLQVLEGEEAAVEACYNRIERDERHVWLRVRSRGPVPARRFPRWSMCGVTLSPLDDALMAPGAIRIDVFHADPDALIQMLSGLSARHGLHLDGLHAELAAKAG